MDILNYIIIILFFFVTGMIMAVIIKPKYKYRGPNANEETNKLFYSKRTNQCIQFGIYPHKC